MSVVRSRWRGCGVGCAVGDCDGPLSVVTVQMTNRIDSPWLGPVKARVTAIVIEGTEGTRGSGLGGYETG